jgi:SAM-dependent methyltransferase
MKVTVIILNLGCGTKTSPRCTNIDWSVTLRLRRSRIGNVLAARLLQGDRLASFNDLDPSRLVVHDLRKGIPAGDATVDVVYHSHVLEHIDRPRVQGFLREVHRVLKPGGIQRVVIPDWEELCRDYLAHVSLCARVVAEQERHDGFIARMIEQLVRTEAHGTSLQPPVRRRLENLLLGSASKRGETHRWMYDAVSLARLLDITGFVDINSVEYNRSAVPGWSLTGLDTDALGNEYKTDSLYMEAKKPRTQGP